MSMFGRNKGEREKDWTLDSQGGSRAGESTSDGQEMRRTRSRMTDADWRRLDAAMKGEA